MLVIRPGKVGNCSENRKTDSVKMSLCVLAVACKRSDRRVSLRLRSRTKSGLIALLLQLGAYII